jgi:hypothetical protein
MTTPSNKTSGPLDGRAEEITFILDLSYHANVDDEIEDGSSLVMRALAQPRGAGPWPRADGEWFEVTLRFLGVQDLRLSAFGPGPRQVMGFAIDDWSDRQLEGIHHKVGDYEDDRISFFCARVVVESRRALPSPPEFLVTAGD